jgi:hypothetical protein
MKSHKIRIQNMKANVPTVIRSVMQAFAVGILIAITSCQPSSPGHYPYISAAEMKAIAAPFDTLSKAYIQAWNTHDTNNMRPLVTDDVTYYESGNNPMLYFASNLMSINKMVLSENPNFQGRQAGIFINRDSAFDIWEMWNYAEDIIPNSIENPISAYDWYTLRDGRIASMWLFWEPELLTAQFGVLIHEKPLQDYEKAWSSGNPQEVANLYAPNAVRHDALFGLDQTGSSAIQGFASKFFTWYPDVSFTRQRWFQLGESVPVKTGGVYTIRVLDQAGKPCDIQAIILLEAVVNSDSSTGKLINEWLFYQPDSLITCGWAQ